MAYVEPKRHDGPDDVRYHHVGSGRTRSDYYCSLCDGWYGVPHERETHHQYRSGYSCACRFCLNDDTGGMLLTHDAFIALWHEQTGGDPMVDFRIPDVS